MIDRRLDCSLVLMMCLLISRGQMKQVKMINLDNRAGDQFPSNESHYTKSATLISNGQLRVLPAEFTLCLRQGTALENTSKTTWLPNYVNKAKT